MRTAPWFPAVALLMTMTAAAMEQPPAKVVVCLDGSVDLLTTNIAERTATDILSTAGVSLRWILPDRYCSDDADIQIRLTRNTPPEFYPGALAFALPYEGKYIQVFYDRIYNSRLGPQANGRILAHVMAHEIAHVLEGINQHSRCGLMKAHWDSGDFRAMRFRPLPFSITDIGLIQQGLRTRGLLAISSADTTPQNLAVVRQECPRP